MKRLPPRIYDRSSPWYTYLERVYGSDVPLPFNLSRLELFYPGLLPTSVHLCQRKPWEGEPSTTRFLPQCAESECKGWLRSEQEAQADRRFYRTWASARSKLWTPITQYWAPTDDADAAELQASGIRASRLRLSGRHLFVGLQAWPRDTLGADGEWVEVIRVSMGSCSPEGGTCKYGRWSQMYPSARTRLCACDS